MYSNARAFIVLFALLVLAVAVSACSASRGQSGVSNNPPDPQSQAVLAGLPALADLPSLAPRGASAEDAQLISGVDASDSSGFFFAQGSSAQLGHPDGGLAYAIYSFNLTPGDTVNRLETAISMNMAGKSFWLGFSDFGNQRWQFQRVSTDGPTFQAGELPALMSNGTTAYVVVVSYFDGGLVVDSLTLITESVGPPVDWAHTWDNSGNESLNCIGIDGASNVYVAGFAESGNAGEAGPMILLKYTASGSLVKARQWIVPVEDFSAEAIQPGDMKVDAAGNCYLLTSVSTSPDFHFGIMKLNSQFELQWSKTWYGPAYDVPSSLTLSPDGQQVIVTADTQLDPEIFDTVPLILYIDAETGAQVSSEYVSVEGSASFYNVAVAPDGTTYFGGFADTTEGTGSLLLKVDDMGLVQSASICGVNGYFGMTIDGSNNLICSAEENSIEDYGSPEKYGTIILKLDPNGAFLDGAVFESADGYYSAGPISNVMGSFEMESSHYILGDQTLGPLKFDANLDFSSFTGFYMSSSLNPLNYGIVRDGGSYCLAASADADSVLIPGQILHSTAEVTELNMGDVIINSISLSKTSTDSLFVDEPGEFADEAGEVDPELKIENDAYTARLTPAI
ncbi:hypothetical protein IT575_08775 [bacterium]|nr:hypothetical protein [bacterium]